MLSAVISSPDSLSREYSPQLPRVDGLSFLLGFSTRPDPLASFAELGNAMGVRRDEVHRLYTLE
jgi:hypothetical protein